MAKLCVLKLNKEFKTAYYHGKSFVHPALILYVRKNRFGEPRFGITTGKKIGKAVQRNRCRRLIREAYRLHYPSISGGWDFVFGARKPRFRIPAHKCITLCKNYSKKQGYFYETSTAVFDSVLSTGNFSPFSCCLSIHTNLLCLCCRSDSALWRGKRHMVIHSAYYPLPSRRRSRL